METKPVTPSATAQASPLTPQAIRELASRDCEYNVICGDFDDRNAAKWCQPCRARLTLESRLAAWGGGF